MTPSREAEIIASIGALTGQVAVLPAVLASSPVFRSAAISAAAVGSCQSSQPGQCPGGNSDRFNRVDGLLGGISSAFGALNNAVLGTITSTLNVINTKLGTQIVGGLSKWPSNIADVVNRSQILNILTYISTLHNAYMLSNALTQTLFSAIGNSLAALGIKDTSTNPDGDPLNIGKIVNDVSDDN